MAKIGAKVLEEAAEVVEAAGEPGDAGREHLVKEVADLVFHALVMLGHRDADWSDVEAELGRRFGVSGLVEKESRRRATRAEPGRTRPGRESEDPAGWSNKARRRAKHRWEAVRDAGRVANRSPGR